MTDQKIYCTSLNDFEKVVKKQKVSHMMTLINEAMMPDTPVTIKRDHHLKLGMNDIAVPTAGLVLPDQDHIARIEKFVLDWDQKAPMLVHCWAGISRSTAAVFISLCILNPDREEGLIGQKLREASPICYPNRKLVQLADAYLQRDGRMVAAVEKMGRGELAPQGKVFSISAKL